MSKMLKLYHLFLVIIHLLLQNNAEESLKWYSRDGNLIAPDNLDESKKENRRFAVIVIWEKKKVTLSCIMDGFEGNEDSKPKWLSLKHI